MIEIEILEQADPNWNDRIKESSLGNYRQTTFQAEHFSNVNVSNSIQRKPQFMYFKKGEEIVGQQLLFLTPRGTTNLKKIFGKIIKPYYYWKNSLLIFDKQHQEEILKEFTLFIKDKKFIGTDNPIANYYLDLPSKKIGTVLIEIKKTFDETISGRDPTSTQKHIAEAAKLGIPTKKGVTIKEIKTESDLDEYIEILNTHRRENLEIKERIDERVKDNFKTLQKCFGGGLLAYHEEKPISGMFYANFNGWIYNMGVANTKYSLKNKLSSLDYIRCWLIALAVKSQARFFDLGGISLESGDDKKQAGIRHSQTKWGGKIVSYNRYSNV